MTSHSPPQVLLGLIPSFFSLCLVILLLLGAIASALLTGLQRHQLTSGLPERYLLEWHKKADSRSSNPLLFFGHTEFIIRRCFLPYVILILALFHVMNWFLIGATVGANIV